MLSTKLHRTRLGPDLIVREDLIQQLNQNIHKPLSLISAPSGYGKSVLVSQWIEQCHINAAWVSLDNEHQDLHVFLEYFLAAIQRIISNDFLKVNEFLKGQQLPPAKVIYEELINDLDQVEEFFVLVLDDYQIIKNDEIHELIDLFITYPVENLHLVIVCRRDPPLKINQLRLFGRINEIRMKDLEFSLGDTQELITKKIDQRLTKQEIRNIYERTEGWVLGLQMILMTNEIQKINAGIQSTIHHSLKEYASFFSDLILSRFSDEFRNALYNASILNRFSIEVLDALFEGNEVATKISGSKFIEELVTNNLFIYPLDGEGIWYRFHHLFGEMLFKLLQKKYTKDQISELHIKASHWFEENEYWDEAYHHALQSGDIDLAVYIININRIRFLNTDQLKRLSRWMSKLPEGTVEKHLGLLTTRALFDEQVYNFSAMKNDLSIAHTLIEKLKHSSSMNKQLLGEYHAVHSCLDFTLGDYENALLHSKQALELLIDKTQYISNYALLFHLVTLNALGRIEEAQAIIRGIIDGLPSTTIYVLLVQSYLNSFRGNIKQIVNAGQKFFPLILDNKMWVLLSTGSYFMSSSYYQLNNPRKAIKYTEALRDHYYSGNPYWEIPTIYTRALSYLALGDTKKLSETIDEIDEVTNNSKPILFREVTKAFKVDIAMRQGDIEKALQLSKTTDFDTVYLDYTCYFQQLTYIRLLIITDHEGNNNEIEELIEKYLEKGRAGHKYNLLMQVLLVQSVYLHKKGDIEAALNSVKEAIALAEPGGFIRIFVDLGYPMKQLLEALHRKEANNRYISRLLDAFEGEKSLAAKRQTSAEGLATTIPAKGIEELSNRETELLTYISQGFRNKEIADELNISIETVKSHVKNSLRKLKARNRVDLVQKAREIEIIK